MGWFDKKPEANLGAGQAEKARQELKTRKDKLDAQIDAQSGGPSGKDMEAANGSYRLTTQDKKIK